MYDTGKSMHKLAMLKKNQKEMLKDILYNTKEKARRLKKEQLISVISVGDNY